MAQGDNRRNFLEVVTIRDSLSNETSPVTRRREVEVRWREGTASKKRKTLKRNGT